MRRGFPHLCFQDRAAVPYIKPCAGECMYKIGLLKPFCCVRVTGEFSQPCKFSPSILHSAPLRELSCGPRSPLPAR